MKRLVFIVTEDWYFCSHRLDLAKEAIRSNFEVFLLSNISNKRQLIEEKGIKIIPLRFLKRSRINIFIELLSVIEICIILKKIKPDILHSVALKPVIYGSLSSFLIPKLININALGGLGFIFSSGSIKARILRPIILNSLKIISNRGRNNLIVQNKDDYFFVLNKLGLKKENISLIEGVGVDTYKFRPTKKVNKTPIVILASRMICDKGISEFVNAAKLLKRRGVIAKFVLVGKPDEENPRAISIDQLNIWHDSKIIEWWGYMKDMEKVLQKASIVTLPSFYGEGIPKILIEAMSSAKPIVTTNMPGCRDLVINQLNGFLVEAKDYIGLANALEKLILNPQLCIEMGLNGRNIALSKYKQERIWKQTIELYNK